MLLGPGPNDPKHPPEVIEAALAIDCRTCNAKPGEPCSSVITAINEREVPHAMRIVTAKAQQVLAPRSNEP